MASSLNKSCIILSLKRNLVARAETPLTWPCKYVLLQFEVGKCVDTFKSKNSLNTQQSCWNFKRILVRIQSPRANSWSDLLTVSEGRGRANSVAPKKRKNNRELNTILALECIMIRKIKGEIL